MEFHPPVRFLLLLHTLETLICGDEKPSNSLEEQSNVHYENVETMNTGGLNETLGTLAEGSNEYPDSIHFDFRDSDVYFRGTTEDRNWVNEYSAFDGHEFFRNMEAWTVEKKLLPSGHTSYMLREYAEKGAAFFRFSSNKVYVIKIRETNKWSVVLRIGLGTTPTLRKAGQKMAMKIFSPLCDDHDVKVEFNRIVDTPKNILPSFPLRSPYHVFKIYEFPIYLLMGTDDKIRVEKIPPSLLWLDNKNDYCLIMDMGQFDIPVLTPIIYCLPSSAENLKLEAKKIGLEFYSVQRFSRAFPITFITQRPTTKNRNLWNPNWRLLYFALETNNNRSGSKLDAIEKRLSSTTGENFVVQRDEAVSLFKISNGFVEWEEVVERPLQFSILDDNDACFVLDSVSLGGIYIVLGENTDLNTRTIAARKAEEIVTNKYDLNTQISIMKHGEENGALKSHFENWTYNPLVLIHNMNLTSDFIREVP